MFLVKHNYARLREQRFAQTDNTIACVMYSLSIISGELFVTLSLTTLSFAMPFHEII